ncbi:MAG: DNA repair protein RadA [Prevotellaceae bacterium]|jgi:DNA repair protein RadA/Sms|nr:DNA repair protein RadA [Prevotellaceae bacterium]
MAKTKTVYFCQQCGFESAKWLGRCPSCGEWNTFVEEVVSKGGGAAYGDVFSSGKAVAQRVDEISFEQQPRLNIENGEVNRLLGGGLVTGSLVLIGGEPGIGKSTLSLQLALHAPSLKTLYVAGEESAQQIKLRADRLRGDGRNCYILGETCLENILAQAQQLQPRFMVIDSIQTLFSERVESSAGSISQIRECAAQLLKFAKQTGIPIFIIGHITKDGSIAGPKVLEHIVDVVLQFEGDGHHAYRLLRSIKNRFGSTAEIGIFEMLGSGLREVSNPSEILITQHDSALSGIAVAATLDGIRPLLIETQALVSSAAYGTPQRSATGFDVRRMNMLLAVLEKRAGFKLAIKDVFLNMAGGLKVVDPAVDLAVVTAILSSNFDIPIPSRYCFAAEVGLSGEIRPVARIDQRIAEAEKTGFERIFISRYNQKGLPPTKSMEIIAVSKMDELLRAVFRNEKG